LLMAIWQRKPAKGLIWHTDRGCQYASDSHRRIFETAQYFAKYEQEGKLLG
jgi:putative transposase